MNTQSTNKLTTRSFLVATAVVAMLFFSDTTQTFGQKGEVEAPRATSRDGLTDTGYLTKAVISDDLEGTDDEYFYKFSAGPGKLTLTFEITANETNAGATLDLFGPNNKAILANLLVQAADGGSELETKSVNLAKAQDIIIRIKGMRYGSSAGYPGVYKIRLDGTAVKFDDAAPPKLPVSQADTPILPASTGKDQNKKPKADLTEASDEKEESVLPATGGESKNKKPEATPTAGNDQAEKPDVIDRVTEKGKKTSKKVLTILDKVKSKIPD